MKLSIENESNIKLIEFSEDHLYNPLYYEWLKDYDTMKYIGRDEYLKPFPFAIVEEYINKIWRRNDIVFFAIYHESDFIGTFKIGDIDSHNSIADIGILIGHKSYKGKGLSKDVMKIGCEYAFNELSIRKLKGGCFKQNIPMNKLFLATGFVLEGVIRKSYLFENDYLDHHLYGMFYNEFRDRLTQQNK